MDDHAVREVLAEYGRVQDENRRVRQNRREAVYERIPELRLITDELAALGISVSRTAFGFGASAPDTGNGVEKLREGARSLRERKSKLLADGGYPADYLDEIYNCANCRDTGYEDNDSQEAKMCFCMKQRLIDRYYDNSNLRGVLEKENFGAFDARYYGADVLPDEGISPRTKIGMILQTCREFVSGFGTGFDNLFFYGSPGLGKTFMCNCIAKELLDAGRTVLYVTAPKIFKIIEEFRFNRDEMSAAALASVPGVLSRLTECELLIIDDLGTEFPTVLTSSELFATVNERLLLSKPTIISTNLTLSDIEGQYSERFTSRLFGNFKMLKFIGGDIRQIKKYKTYA